MNTISLKIAVVRRTSESEPFDDGPRSNVAVGRRSRRVGSRGSRKDERAGRGGGNVSLGAVERFIFRVIFCLRS